MFKDTFISVKDNIVKKVTNPFLSTFVGVWIVRNWEFVYFVFFFDDSYSLKMRLTEIESYFADYSFWDIAITILITFGILISTFVLLSVSRLIVNFFDKVVTPKLYKWTDKGSVVLKNDYQALETEIGRLENKYQEEKENRFQLNKEIERLEARIAELISINQLEQKDEDVGIDGDFEKNELDESDKLDKELNYKEEKAMWFYNKLMAENLLNKFKILITEISNGNAIMSTDQFTKMLVTYGFIRLETNYSSEKAYYTFTDKGDELKNIVLYK